MTQKQVAQNQEAAELLNKYLVKIVGASPLNEHSQPNDVEFAATCADIALEAILKALTSIKDRDVRGSVLLDLIEHYRGIQKEINKFL